MFLSYEAAWPLPSRWDYVTETNAARSIAHFVRLIEARQAHLTNEVPGTLASFRLRRPASAALVVASLTGSAGHGLRPPLQGGGHSAGRDRPPAARARHSMAPAGPCRDGHYPPIPYGNGRPVPATSGLGNLVLADAGAGPGCLWRQPFQGLDIKGKDLAVDRHGIFDAHHELHMQRAGNLADCAPFPLP